MEVTWHALPKKPESYGEYWLWWPGLLKPVLGEYCWSKPEPIFRTNDYGVRDEVTHYAKLERPEIPKNPFHEDERHLDALARVTKVKIVEMCFISVVGSKLTAHAKRKDAEDRAMHYCDRGLKTVVIETKIVAVHNPTKKAIRKRKLRLKKRKGDG